MSNRRTTGQAQGRAYKRENEGGEGNKHTLGCVKQVNDAGRRTERAKKGAKEEEEAKK